MEIYLPHEFQETASYCMEARLCCKFYRGLYLKMRSWFGSSDPYWLTKMLESKLLENILRMNIRPSMITIYLNISIKIRRQYRVPYALLEIWRDTHKDTAKCKQRQEYYKNNILRIKQYNEDYHKLKMLRINIFRKVTPSTV